MSWIFEKSILTQTNHLPFRLSYVMSSPINIKYHRQYFISVATFEEYTSWTSVTPPLPTATPILYFRLGFYRLNLLKGPTCLLCLSNKILGDSLVQRQKTKVLIFYTILCVYNSHVVLLKNVYVHKHIGDEYGCIYSKGPEIFRGITGDRHKGISIDNKTKDSGIKLKCTRKSYL